MGRTGRVERKTAETEIVVEVNIDGSGRTQVDTGVGFLDHMLTLLAGRSLIDVQVQACGDLHVDQHHTVEDVGICLGCAIREALGGKAGIRRYGHFALPMEETLVTAAVDLGGGRTSCLKPRFPPPRSANSTASS